MFLDDYQLLQIVNATTIPIDFLNLNSNRKAPRGIIILALFFLMLAFIPGCCVASKIVLSDLQKNAFATLERNWRQNLNFFESEMFRFRISVICKQNMFVSIETVIVFPMEIAVIFSIKIIVYKEREN